MRHYETMFILKPTLLEEEISSKIEYYKEVLVKNGASIHGYLDMGMRNLAYEIRKNKRGYYFVIYFTASPLIIPELERLYRINEDVLRFIIIKYISKKEQQTWATLIDRSKNPGSTSERSIKKTESKNSTPQENIGENVQI